MESGASMAVANPLNDAEPEPARSSEPREEKDELEEEQEWVTLSLAPRVFPRIGAALSAAGGAPTPLARALYAVLGLYPPFFLFVGVNGENILTEYSDPVDGPVFVGFATFFACVGLGGFHSLRSVTASVDTAGGAEAVVMLGACAARLRRIHVGRAG